MPTPKNSAWIVATASALALVPIAPPAAAESSDETEHCVAWTQPTGFSDALDVVDLRCFASFSEALAAAGGASDGYSAQASGDRIIGIHYDGRGMTGSSFSVVGSNCLGGYLNVSDYWNNRVSSTWNGCPAIRHFDGFNLIGAYETTFSPGGDLWSLDNRTSSIQYRS